MIRQLLSRFRRKPPPRTVLHTYAPLAFVVPLDEQYRRWPCLFEHSFNTTCNNCGERQMQASQAEMNAWELRTAHIQHNSHNCA